MLRSALAAGCDHAVKHFEREGHSIDAGLHAHITRHYAGLRLDADGLSGLGYRRFGEPNSALVLANEWVTIRVLKASHGIDAVTGEFGRILPTPGPSHRRREYYRQPALFDLSDAPTHLKLVTLWDVDGAFQLSVMDLACPRVGEDTRDSVEHHWLVKVPFDDGSADFGTRSSEPSPSVGPFDDLPIERRLDDDGMPLGAGIR